MSIQNLKTFRYIGLLPNGDPNSLGTVGVYVAGTSFATLATIWDTQTKDTELSNPVTLDSDGTKEIWFDVAVDIREKDFNATPANGNVVDQALAIDPIITVDTTGNYNLVTNGSFEVDSDGDGAPDSWTLAEDTSGTIAIDAATGGQTHGDNGLKFTGTGSGGGTATSDFFAVPTGGNLLIAFTYKSTAADTTNKVDIFWFKFDDSASSPPSTQIHSDTSANPSSFTTYKYRATVPSDAVKGKVVLTGVKSDGTDKSGPTWFDNIEIIQDQFFSGKQTMFIPASAMTPTVSNGCAFLVSVETTNTRPDINVLDFDASSDEHAQFQMAFPKSWDEGTITFQVFWTTTASDTDGVAWGLQGVGVADGDTIDVAYGTAIVVTDDAQSAAEDTLVTVESAAVTIAGTPAAGDMTYFRIFRDVSDGNDDMTEDARLIGIKLHFTTNATQDE